MLKDFYFLGSSCIYPKLGFSQPIFEEELLSNYLEPTNESYALAKILGIRLCTSLRKQYGFDAISLMPTNLYGPGDNYHPKNSHVLPSLIRKFHNAKINNFLKLPAGVTALLLENLCMDDLGNASLFALENWDPSKSNSPKYANGEPLTFLNVGQERILQLKILQIKYQEF